MARRRHQPGTLVIAQGDTTTTMAAALGAYYVRIPFWHIEAGLRSGNKYSPWPEEVNRKIATAIADVHCAPTELARANLLAEKVDDRSIIVTGNTVVDALLGVREPQAAIETRLNLRRLFLERRKRHRQRIDLNDLRYGERSRRAQEHAGANRTATQNLLEDHRVSLCRAVLSDDHRQPLSNADVASRFRWDSSSGAPNRGVDLLALR